MKKCISLIFIQNDIYVQFLFSKDVEIYKSYLIIFICL